jgi:hypothetical protein
VVFLLPPPGRSTVVLERCGRRKVTSGWRIAAVKQIQPRAAIFLRLVIRHGIATGFCVHPLVKRSML